MSSRATSSEALGCATPVGAVGCVIIGRNEGERLKRCIASAQQQPLDPIVYVDSGSTDGSLQYAASRGVVPLALDLSRPFTMGRARNAGFAELMVRARGLEYVQFVDGDCELDDGWVRHGQAWLAAHAELAAVCGELREHHPRASAYNRLFDMELRGPCGAITACGGVAMYRVRDFATSGGFDERMIAGEEPELCARLQRVGRGIWRLPQPMARHDADMHTFQQWWLRSIRSGYAYADGFALRGVVYGNNLRHLARCLIWGAALPIACLGGVLFGGVVMQAGLFALGAAMLIAVAWLKIGAGSYRYRRGLGDSREDSALYAVACVVAKVPEALGVMRFVRNRLLGRRSQLIEYRRRRPKRDPPETPAAPADAGLEQP